MVEFEIEASLSSFLKLANAYSENFNMQLLLSGDLPESNPSYLCLFPQDEIIISWQDLNPWETLKEKLSFSSQKKTLDWVGYLSYEMSAFSDLDKKRPHTKSDFLLAHFVKPSVICTYLKNRLTVQVFEVENEPFNIKIEKQKFSSAKLFSSFLNSLKEINLPQFSYAPFSESDSLNSYLSKIEQIKEYILKGEVYQVNLSRSVTFKTDAIGFNLFYKLFKINPTPFSAFLNFKGYQIISASPERFLRKNNNFLETRPIKGTLQRGENPQEDARLRFSLLNSAKEEAELMMITDLMRNDLGSISQIGSVKCLEKKKILELSNVFHLESTIVSKPLNKHPIDLIQACYPAGSISGCPKLRAQEIIQDIEKRPRHIYTGAIGYFSKNGDFDLNVAIRTALLKDQTLKVQIGGAITYDSLSELEYKETTHKGSPFFKIFQAENFISK